MASVYALFCVGCPFAVIRRVWSAVVNSLNCVFTAWALAHIIQKIFKLQPSFANDNPARSIQSIASVFGIFASGDHSSPNRVFGRAALIMGKVAFGNGVSLQTATTFGFSASKLIRSDNRLISTTAFAKPKRNAVDTSFIAKHLQATILFTRFVFESTIYRKLCHAVIIP